MKLDNLKWVAGGLLFPAPTLSAALVNLGIPSWAIRLDFLGIMLPTLSMSYRQDGDKWQCITMNTECVPMAATTEADARAIKLIHLIESGQVKVESVLKGLESLTV